MTAFRACAGSVLCLYRGRDGSHRARLLTEAETRRCWEEAVDLTIAAQGAGNFKLYARAEAINNQITLAQAQAQRWRKASGGVPSIPTNQGRAA